MKEVAVFLIGIALLVAAFQSGPSALAQDVTTQMEIAQGQ